MVDIMEVLVTALDEKILGEWRHEGFNGGWSTDYANFVIDDKEYVIRIEEVTDTAADLMLANAEILRRKAELDNVVKRGRWFCGEYDTPRCSECLSSALLDGSEDYVKSKYCPNCGAKMDLVEQP